MVDLPLNLRTQSARPRSEIFLSRSAIECHRTRPGTDFDSFGTLEEFNPSAQRLFSEQITDVFQPGPVLEQLSNYLAQIDTRLNTDEQVTREVERIKGSERFLTEDDILISLLGRMKEEFKSFEKNSDIESLVEKFRTNLEYRNKYYEYLKKNPDVYKQFENTPGDNLVEKFKNFVSERIKKDKANIEANIKKSESQKDDAEKLLRARASYNINKDPSVFNPYLPTRNFLTKDLKTLAEYDALVNMLMKRSVICWGSGERSGRNFTIVPDFKRKGDESSKYLICASIAELFYKRPDLVQLVTNAKTPFEVILLEGLSGTGGLAFSDANRITINNRLLMFETSDSVTETDPYEINPVAHEFLHALDKFSSEGLMDGNIPGLSRNQRRIFEEERTRLTDTYSNYRNGKTKEELESINRQTYDPATGLPNYTFSGSEHFVVVTSTLFHRNPKILKKVNPKLFNFYCDFYRFNPLLLYSNNE